MILKRHLPYLYHKTTMSIPDFESLMLPLLKLVADDQEYAMRELIETLAWEFSLTDAQKQKLIPSGLG